MLDIGWTELVVIGVVALIVIGPRDLPEMFRTLGRFTAKLRSMSREFSRAMEAAADEAGVKDVAKDLKSATSAKSMGLDAVKDAAAKFEKWDPLKNAAKPTTPTVKPLTPAPMPANPVMTPVGGIAVAPEAALAVPTASAPKLAPEPVPAPAVVAKAPMPAKAATRKPAKAAETSATNPVATTPAKTPGRVRKTKTDTASGPESGAAANTETKA